MISISLCDVTVLSYASSRDNSLLAGVNKKIHTKRVFDAYADP